MLSSCLFFRKKRLDKLIKQQTCSSSMYVCCLQTNGSSTNKAKSWSWEKANQMVTSLLQSSTKKKMFSSLAVKKVTRHITVHLANGAFKRANKRVAIIVFWCMASSNVLFLFCIIIHLSQEKAPGLLMLVDMSSPAWGFQFQGFGCCMKSCPGNRPFAHKPLDLQT